MPAPAVRYHTVLSKRSDVVVDAELKSAEALMMHMTSVCKQQ